MQIDLFLLIAFVALNIATLFLIKSRTNLIISLIISHLLLIVFLGVLIDDYAHLDKINIAFTAFSIAIVSLICYKKNQLKGSLKSGYIIIFAAFVALSSSSLLILMAKDISYLNKQKTAFKTGALLNPNPSLEGQFLLSSGNDGSRLNSVKKNDKNSLQNSFVKYHTLAILLIMIISGFTPNLSLESQFMPSSHNLSRNKTENNEHL